MNELPTIKRLFEESYDELVSFTEVEKVLLAHEAHAKIEVNDRNYALEVDDRHSSHFGKSDEAIELEREYWRGRRDAIHALKGEVKK